MDGRTLGPVDRGRMGCSIASALPPPLAPCPRLFLTKARARPARARSRSHCGLAGQRLAADPKKAQREQAQLVLIDESGLLMAPLVRRTWAVRGQTPVLQQRGKHRERVSVAAAL